MQVVKVKGGREDINGNYMGKKQEEQLGPLGFEKNPSLKSLPQSEGHCNHGCTELDPAGHNCTDSTDLGWLLPGVGFVQCGNCNHQWKEIGLAAILQDVQSNFLHTL